MTIRQNSKSHEICDLHEYSQIRECTPTQLKKNFSNLKNWDFPKLEYLYVYGCIEMVKNSIIS